ncbi:hypothetical protein ACHAXN_011698 [Cyclotella atomus]
MIASDRTSRTSTTATAPPSSRHAHRFALYCIAFSSACFLLLSLLCNSRFGDSYLYTEDDLPDTFQYPNVDTATRSLQQWEHSELIHEVHTVVNVTSSSFACEDIFKSSHPKIANADADGRARHLCHHAKSCDGDWPSTTLLPLILCLGIDDDGSTGAGSKSSIFQSAVFVFCLLPPLILCYLYLLFRLLATTADCYFSPALETFSFEMGLPPRFAGATLLALGNGSPDLGSTINAILLWNESPPIQTTILTNSKTTTHHKTAAEGWTMSLGSLTGGGMFVGTIVTGLIVQSTNGITCRGAFLRDVSMYALSIGTVWYLLESNSVTRRDVYLLLGMWLGYVTIVFLADMYHRKVTLPRLHAEGKERRKSLKLEKLKRLSAIANNTSADKQNEVVAEEEEVLNETTPLTNYFAPYGLEAGEAINNTSADSIISIDYTNESKPRVRISVTDRFAMFLSNYEPASVKFDYSSSRAGSAISNDDSDTTTIHNVMHQIHSIRRTSLALPTDENNNLFGSIQSNEFDEVKVGSPEKLHAFPENLDEDESVIDEGDARSCSKRMIVEAYQEIVYEARCYWENRFVKEPSGLERFGFLLELPITIIRTLTIPVPCEDHYNRVIVALSTAISPCWVLWYFGADFNPKSIAYCAAALAVAFSVIRFGGDEKLPLVAAAPLSLYGFFIATTWIDVIGNNLVGLLQFLGTICRIPAPILGVTVLAWGNSLGDLSANVAMARKGMPDMATTANFAGPSFNLLLGVGLGFLSLQNKLQTDTIYPVSITRSIRIGFSFNVLNCLLIVFCAVACQWRLPYRYSYAFFAIYLMFIAMSLSTLV